MRRIGVAGQTRPPKPSAGPVMSVVGTYSDQRFRRREMSLWGRCADMSDPAVHSIDARADIDLGCGVGVAGEAHLITAQLSQAVQPPRADFGQEVLR